PVALERLVDLNWPTSPPRTAAKAVMVSVSQLRAALTKAGVAAGAAELVRQGSGYALRTDPMNIDAHRFHRLVRQAPHAPSDEQTPALLDQALRLWSGPALDGAASVETREVLCRSLDDARLAALESRFDAELRLARHHEIVGELSRMVEENPQRERLVGQL